ncbi:MAG: hypothetical protein ABEJ91_00575 [Candidatus Nanohaloarchaea archaeon]
MEIGRREALETVLKVPRPVLAVMILVGMVAGIVSVGSLTPRKLLVALYLSVASCYSVFGINDYYDRDTDAENDRKGGIQGEIAVGEKKEIVK